MNDNSRQSLKESGINKRESERKTIHKTKIKRNLNEKNSKKQTQKLFHDNSIYSLYNSNA